MRRTLPVVGTLLAVLLVACGGGGDDDAASTDRLVVSQISETRDLLSIDPLKTMDTTLPTTAVYDTLLRRVPGGEIRPGLATSAEPVGSTWVVRLRSGVTFSDGSRLDAEDVKATVDHMLAPANASSFSRILFGVTGVQVRDAQTAVLTMSKPNRLLDKSLALVPVVSSEQLAQGDEYATKLVGTGPYALSAWKRGQSVTLERRDDYWGEKPVYKTVEVKAVPDPAGRLADLQSGGAGIVADLLPTQLEPARSTGAKVLTEPPLRTAYLQVVPAGPLADARVRQALYAAVDRQALTKAAGGKGAEVATSVVPKTSGGHVETFPVDDHDPAAAKALLEQAGVKTPVRFTLDVTSDMSAAAQLLQAQVKDAGFAAEINLVDTKAALFDPKRATEAGDARVLMATALDDHTFDALRPFSALYGTATTPTSLGFAADDATQRLVDAYAAAPETQRSELSGQVQASAKRTASAIFLYFPKPQYAVADGVCWDTGDLSQIDLSRVRPCG